MYTMQGSCIWKGMFSGTVLHSERMFPAGSYIVRIETDKGPVVQKLVNIQP